MLKVRTLLLALTASLMLSSVAVADDVVLLVESHGPSSDNTEYYVPLEKAKKLPQWQPLSNQEPPLSFRKAVAIALRKTKPDYPKQVRWELYSAEMSKFHIKDHDSWFYKIRFSAPPDCSYTPPVLVLMDGSIARNRTVKDKPAKKSR